MMFVAIPKLSTQHVAINDPPFWNFMSTDFTILLNDSLRRGWFPNGVTHGLIELLFKDGDLLKLKNWRLITLLNTSCKIFAKALQWRLQPLLVEVIDNYEIVFLPLRFILDNMLLTHESIQWAKWSRQDSIFCELDLSKAYDRVGWTSSNMQSLLRYHIKQLQPYHSS